VGMGDGGVTFTSSQWSVVGAQQVGNGNGPPLKAGTAGIEADRPHKAKAA